MSYFIYESFKKAVLAQGSWLVWPIERLADSWTLVAAIVPPYAVATEIEVICDGLPVKSSASELPPIFKHTFQRLGLKDLPTLTLKFTAYPGDDATTLSCFTMGGEQIGGNYYISKKPSQTQFAGTSAMRVIRSNDQNYYHFTGYDEAQKIHKLISAHLERSRNAAKLNVLDWGVGSGRVTQYLQQFSDIEMFGTDIDPINMTSLHSAGLPQSNFVLTSPGGPIPFDSESMDAVFGISVFTHLTEKMQFYYLSEIQRVLKPNGIGIFSVHGLSHFFMQINDGHTLAAFVEDGIMVTGANEDLTAGFAESSHLYVNTLHTPDYILRWWAVYFSAVSIKPAALVNTHDLVVCKWPRKST